MEARTEQAPGRIFTFFSFKGGVGRTLALANVGFLLASYGRSVLLVDADLEAPGLTLFLLPKRPSAQPGFVDFFLKVREVFLRRAQSPTQSKSPPDLDPKHYLVPLDLPRELLTSPVGKPGRVSLMPAGRLDENYVSRLADVRIGETYQAGYGAPLAWEIRRHLQEAGFDYVLIDSRTGYSDISGALLIDVSDRTVVISGLNRQNVEGTRRYLEEIGFLPAPEPPKSRRFLLVASPVPREEVDLRDDRLGMFAGTLGRSPDVELTYHPRLALTEELFVASQPKDELSRGYRTLASIILDAAHDGIEAHLRAASEALRDRDLFMLSREVELVGRQSPEQAVAYLRGVSDFLTDARPNEAGNEKVLELICALDPKDDIAFNNWGNHLGALACLETDPAAARPLFEQAFAKYARATEIKPDYHEAFNNWGTNLFLCARRLRKIGATVEADQMALEAANKFDLAARIHPEGAEMYWVAALPLLEVAASTDNAELAKRAKLLATSSAQSLKSPFATFTLALAHVLSGDRKSAEEIIRKLEVSADRKEWLHPFLTDSMLAPKLRALIESVTELKKDRKPRQRRGKGK